STLAVWHGSADAPAGARDHHRPAVGNGPDAPVAAAARCAFGQSGTGLRHARVRRNSMKKALMWLLLVLPVHAYAQQVPWGRPDMPVSSHDRVYAADQTSNTVSVIDPASNTLLGVLRLGDPVPGALSPLYKGQLLVHGLGYAPNAKTLTVVAV